MRTALHCLLLPTSELDQVVTGSSPCPMLLSLSSYLHTVIHLKRSILIHTTPSPPSCAYCCPSRLKYLPLAHEFFTLTFASAECISLSRKEQEHVSIVGNNMQAGCRPELGYSFSHRCDGTHQELQKRCCCCSINKDGRESPAAVQRSRRSCFRTASWLEWYRKTVLEGVRSAVLGSSCIERYPCWNRTCRIVRTSLVPSIACFSITSTCRHLLHVRAQDWAIEV